MATVIPYVPQYITVHLGPPSVNAANVTVTFKDYVKNVASSEIYPTWERNALKANIYAITSFALNRVYTEFYRSRGYDFEITNSTAYDQAFVNGRGFFSSISQLVDEMFNDYLRRPGFIEPLAAKFCNGTTVTCQGLSQWGSQNLALQGYNDLQILKNYYNNFEIVTNAPIRGITASYPGSPLRLGSTGPNVVVLQVSVNSIADNYPAIPKIPATDGIFGPRTEASVRSLQKIFDLTPDGIVGPATWYEIVRLYGAVNALSELKSQGQRFGTINWSAPNALKFGDTGDKVRLLQYMLSVLSAYIPDIPLLNIDGIYGNRTKSAVLSAQGFFRLPQTGSVDAATWDAVYDQYFGIENISLRGYNAVPKASNTVASRNTALPTKRSSTVSSITQFPGRDLGIGAQDPARKEVSR